MDLPTAELKHLGAASHSNQLTVIVADVDAVVGVFVVAAVAVVVVAVAVAVSARLVV
jgi:hypothetical protein